MRCTQHSDGEELNDGNEMRGGGRKEYKDNN